ncbi:FAS1-like dehydratase domain-containing protein [Streptomyces sp. GQFP]|uniref:FAS1-like dehydratase domain-containing protein n=1 Tax=Streptomyces sp. GQFP TaxID=2907545 RepID=UPI001F1C12BC|nr:MaoC family dehydratase N-terminal domain-containing protein [Streptomyces sp. GQFP]UIX29286.1 MaoC family dehydratase N-terminal domain-containing protein [Streptomyces sp. GQFP]
MTTPPPQSAPVGATGTEYEVPVERGKISEFAAAMQSENPAYQGLQAITPPTFLACAARWAPEGGRIETGFERARLLHGEQEYVFHGPPPRAGDTLIARERLIDRYTKAGKRGGEMRFAVVTTEFRSPAGDLVAEARATYIETAAKEGAK